MSRSVRFALALGTLLCACSGDDQGVEAELARPVTVALLESTSPRPGELVPGLVTPYRQTSIAFEVTGRVTQIVDVGEELIGEQTDVEGAVVQAGGVIAQLDPAPFERAKRQAEQRLEAARLELEAQVVQLEEVLVARLESARAQAASAELNTTYARDDVAAMEASVELAATTLKRNQDLLPKKAVSDIVVRQSETELQTQRSRLARSRTLVTAREREFDAAQAAIAEVEGTIALQRASNHALEANIAELEEVVRDAASHLDDCVLRAPFAGRVTEHHAGEGSFVAAGSPVVTLTMMTPVEIEISVSADEDERLAVGMDAMVYPMVGNKIDQDLGIRATLYEKRGVADASTRTFRLGLIAANRRRTARPELAGLPSARFLAPIIRNPFDVPGEDGLFTLAETVDRSGGEASVLRVRDLSRGGRNATSLNGRLLAERVRVEASSQVIQVASFKLIELTDAGELNPDDLLVPDPTPAHEEGFVVSDSRWRLRPGDLVQVSLEQRTLPTGFYVPVQAISEVSGVTSVFVVDGDARARAVRVEVEESIGERRRIVAPGIQEGGRVVIQGAHFLQDGDKVTLSGAAAGASL